MHKFELFKLTSKCFSFALLILLAVACARDVTEPPVPQPTQGSAAAMPTSSPTPTSASAPAPATATATSVPTSPPTATVAPTFQSASSTPTISPPTSTPFPTATPTVTPTSALAPTTQPTATPIPRINRSASAEAPDKAAVVILGCGPREDGSTYLVEVYSGSEKSPNLGSVVGIGDPCADALVELMEEGFSIAGMESGAFTHGEGFKYSLIIEEIRRERDEG